MTLEGQVVAAIAADLAFGDPRWLPHPVRLIGRVAMSLEAPTRRVFTDTRLAGIITACLTVGGTALVAWALVQSAARLHPLLGDMLSIILLYTCFAARDLADHAIDVFRALRSGDLELARNRVARMVGRDTGTLDETGVVRAAVESVGENTVDGVTAPLFFAVLGGPVLAIAYKAVSTLDSSFGYKNERYLKFGWASARLDDLAAWLPARLTFPLVAVAALLTGARPVGAWRYGLRDCGMHSSPNAGLPEAAFAGALGVQLGGPLMKHGQPIDLPRLGEPMEPLNQRQILRSVFLMLTVSLLAAAWFLSIRVLAHGGWGTGE
jgi:adenosylcobinamide-phosphate synthase